MKEKVFCDKCEFNRDRKFIYCGWKNYNINPYNGVKENIVHGEYSDNKNGECPNYKEKQKEVEDGILETDMYTFFGIKKRDIYIVFWISFALYLITMILYK